MTKFSRVDKLLSNIEEIVLGLLLATASFILFANVVARYFFNWGFSWAEELVRYEIIWMVFLGGSIAAREGLHIGVDLLVRIAPPPLRKLLLVTVNGVSALFCGFLAYFGFSLLSQTKAFGQVSPALEVPMWTVQAAIPLGALFMTLRFLQQIWHLLLGEKMESHVEGLG